jgi:plastocyanin
VTFTPNPESLLPFRDDEVPGVIAFEERGFFDMGCGRAGQPVCVLSDPDEIIGLGTPILHTSDDNRDVEPFDAVIDLPEGTYSYICIIHYPVMQGTVEVVADDVPLTNPDAEELAALIAAETAAADALFSERSRRRFADEHGSRIWLANAGTRTHDDGGTGIVGFLPAALEINAGDTVRWIVEDDAHTVSFPSVAGVTFPFLLNFNCEPDEPNGGLPGVPLLGLLEVVHDGCPADWQLEMTFNELAKPQPAPGNAVLTEASWHHSGVLAPADQRGDWHIPTEFEAIFPVPGEFTYRCYIHPEVMTGSVIVR